MEIIALKITENEPLPHKKYVYTLDSSDIFYEDWTQYINWCLREFN